MPLPIVYNLEIYASASDAVADLEAKTPFATISVGDILETAAWGQNSYMGEAARLKVTRVEHLISWGEFIRHKVCVYADAAA